jgi:hypothetical protein
MVVRGGRNGPAGGWRCQPECPSGGRREREGTSTCLLLWSVTRCVVPGTLRRVSEPLGSQDARYRPGDAAQLASQTQLGGWRVTRGRLWLTIEGTLD